MARRARRRSFLGVALLLFLFTLALGRKNYLFAGADSGGDREHRREVIARRQPLRAFETGLQSLPKITFHRGRWILHKGENAVSLGHNRQALEVQDLRGATLYSTLEPCGMCTMASVWTGVSRIVFGAGRADVHKMYFEDRHLGTMDFIRDAYRNDLALAGGVLAQECAALYYGPDDDPPSEEQANI